MQNKCVYCKRKNHDIGACRLFGKERSKRRWSLAKKMGLCFLCLSDRHYSRDCNSEAKNCEHCNDRHHTLLHFFKRVDEKRVRNNTHDESNSKGVRGENALETEA